MNNLIIFVIICIFLIIFLTKVYTLNDKKLEHLTQQSDEAIQNVASLYNEDKLTIGSLNVTGEAKADSLVAGTITDKSMNSTVKSYIDSKIADLTNNLNKKITTAQNGVDSLNKVIILRDLPWNSVNWVQRIQSEKYFKRSDPDGTIKHFMIVHPHHMNRAYGRHIVYLVAVKAGNQFLIWWVHNPSHHDMPNPFGTNNSSNAPAWRGNIQ